MINKYSDVPLYCQLKALILKKIDSGDYAQDSKIPSEQELCDIYNISRPTVRQAISELTNSGYLYKEKGKGTFVSRSKTHIDIKSYSGFTDSLLDSEVPGEKEIISIDVIKNIDFQKLDEIFNILRNQRVDFAEIKYVSIWNGEVFALNVSYIPISLFPNIVEDIKDKKPSYDIMRGKYPLIPAKTKSSLEIIYAEQCDSQFLQVQTGQALIRIENVLYSKSSQAVEHVITKYRADKCKLIFENSR